jgi:hypothetical protein
LLAIVHEFLEKKDPEGHLAAMEVLIKMSKRDGYVANFHGIDSKMNEIASETPYLEVFCGVLRILVSMRLRPSFDVRAIAQKLISPGQNDELVATVKRLIDEVPKPRRGSRHQDPPPE